MRKTICYMVGICMSVAILGGCGNSSNTTVQHKTEDQTTVVDNTVEEASTAAAWDSDNGYCLNEIGTIQDTEKKLRIDNGLKIVSNNSYEFYDYLGKDTGKSYISIDGLEKEDGGDLEGYYTVAKDGEYPNIRGLVNMKGEEIIPCEAGIIKALSDRYLSVVYGTEETSSKNEALFYSYTGFASISGPEKDDTLYKGYMQVYDLENRKMIPNIKITKNTEELKACGNSIYWKKDDGTSEIYNAEGNMILTDKGKNGEIEVHNGLLKLGDKIYNDAGEEVADVKENATPQFVSGNTQYILYSKNENGKTYNTVVDVNGNTIIEKTEKYISSINDEIVCFSEYDGEKYLYGLMTLQGDEIIAPNEKNYSYCEEGYWQGSNDYNSYDLISENGVIATNVKLVHDLVCLVNGSTKYVVLKGESQTVDLKDEYVDTLTTALVASEENNLYGVVDLYTGEQLLGYEYEEIVYESGYIYAYKGGQWTIFEVQLMQR